MLIKHLVDNADHCKNVTGATDFSKCIEGKQAWVIKLGQDEQIIFMFLKHLEKHLRHQLYLKDKFIFLFINHHSGIDRCVKDLHLFVYQMMSVVIIIRLN